MILCGIIYLVLLSKTDGDTYPPTPATPFSPTPPSFGFEKLVEKSRSANIRWGRHDGWTSCRAGYWKIQQQRSKHCDAAGCLLTEGELTRGIINKKQFVKGNVAIIICVPQPRLAAPSNQR